MLPSMNVWRSPWKVWRERAGASSVGDGAVGEEGGVRELPSRTYTVSARAEQRVLPFGVQHPAKMHPSLCRDLFLRYTREGQTVLDPFGGRGTALLGITLQRNVILNELEPPFVEHIWANYEHLRTNSLPCMALGEATILQGDSRSLSLPTAADAVVSSPPYGDVADRHRETETRYATADAEKRAFMNRYGEGDPNRHISGYGDTTGQIGALPHAAITSPPWSDANPQGNTNGEKGIHSDEGMVRLKKDYVRFQHPDSIANKDGETYATACLAVYRECYRVVRPGGVLVLVTGNYVRSGAVIDLAADTIKLAVAAGWTPVERWRHEKSQVSFWRRLHHKQGRPVVTHEDVLVFCKGEKPGWDFTELAPTYRAPADLSEANALVGLGETGVLPLPLFTEVGR